MHPHDAMVDTALGIIFVIVVAMLDAGVITLKGI